MYTEFQNCYCINLLASLTLNSGVSFQNSFVNPYILIKTVMPAQVPYQTPENLH